MLVKLYVNTPRADGSNTLKTNSDGFAEEVEVKEIVNRL